MRFLADRRQHFFPADRRKSHFFGSTAASTLLCANPYCIPALRACIPTMFKHFLACISIISKLFSLCAFLVYSGTASRGTMLESSRHYAHYACISMYFYCVFLLYFYCFLLTILFCFSTSFLYYALLLYSSTAWVLCYCVPAIAFQHYFILCVFPLRVLILFLATSIFSMRISIVLQHFVVRACLLCSTFLLYSKTPRQKCGQEGPLNNFFLLCGGMFGHSSCLNRTKECHREGSDPPKTESQKKN